MNDDLKELLALLKSHQVEFLVIGAHAVGFYGRPRFTEDLDVWVNPTNENSLRLERALREFGAPIGPEGADRFANKARQMVRIGNPPNMVDLLNFAGNEPFAEVWDRSLPGDLEGIEIRIPAKVDLILMKRASNRPKDQADIAQLEDKTGT